MHGTYSVDTGLEIWVVSQRKLFALRNNPDVAFFRRGHVTTWRRGGTAWECDGYHSYYTCEHHSTANSMIKQPTTPTNNNNNNNNNNNTSARNNNGNSKVHRERNYVLQAVEVTSMLQAISGVMVTR